MRILEGALLALLLGQGLICSYTDIKYGLVRNKYILFGMCAAVVLDVVYYAFFSNDTTILFLMNCASAILLAVCLFFSHNLAGGDAKLIAVLSLAYPSSFYFEYAGIQVTLFFAVAFAILYGYIFLVLSSVYRIVTGKADITKKYAADYLKSFFIAYCRALVYVVFFNLLFELLNRLGIQVPTWLMLMFSMSAALLSSRIQLLKTWKVIIPTFVICVVLAVFLKTVPLSTYPSAYLLTAFFMLAQLAVRVNIYDEVPSKSVAKGMILSTGSSLLMQGIRIDGLPQLSSESLKDRLTEAEAESIHKWADSKYGQQTVVIVRKIPFAVFLLLGYATYFLIWSYAR